MTFRSLSSEVEPASKISVTLPWVHAAGQPYIDWLLGDRSAALQILEQWMRHPSSEVFIGRAVVLVDEAQQVGGFIAVSGSDLARCRMHDAVSAVAASTPERRASLLDRLRLGRPLFPEVAADELYLSRVGVHTRSSTSTFGTEFGMGSGDSRSTSAPTTCPRSSSIDRSDSERDRCTTLATLGSRTGG